MAKRIMALDLGDKWIGVAISDELELLASAKPPIKRHSHSSDLQNILGLTTTWDVEQIVVGLPLNMNATVGPQAEKTLKFVEDLKAEAPCNVTMWDERLTTRLAERLLIEQNVRRDKRKKVVDGLAAELILQGYLDHKQHTNSREDILMDDEKNLVGHGPEDEDEIITLTDEEGHEHEFVVVDVIEVEEQDYAILLPIDTSEEEEAEAVILRLEKDDDGDDILVDIESEEEWEKVAQAYEELLDDDE
jgi:putative Holliday junction resolvase